MFLNFFQRTHFNFIFHSDHMHFYTICTNIYKTYMYIKKNCRRWNIFQHTESQTKRLQSGTFKRKQSTEVSNRKNIQSIVFCCKNAFFMWFLWPPSPTWTEQMFEICDCIWIGEVGKSQLKIECLQKIWDLCFLLNHSRVLREFADRNR